MSYIKTLCFIIPFLFLSACNNDSQDNTYNYPETRKVATVDTYFGVEVEDPYRWLEDDTSEEVANWVDEQNAVTDEYMKKISFRQKIVDRYKELWNYEKMTIPNKIAGKYFFSKNSGVDAQDILYMQDTLDSEPKELLNPNEFSQDGTTLLVDYKVKSDGKYIAYLVSKNGSDWREMYVKNIQTGEILEDHIKWIKHYNTIAWHEEGLFYSAYDEPTGSVLSQTNEYNKAYYHKLGTSQEEDTLIYENKEAPSSAYNVQPTSDEKYLLMRELYSDTTSALYFKNASAKDELFTKLTIDNKSDYHVVGYKNGRVYVLTNYQAPNYRLVEIDLDNYIPETWKEIIFESDNVIDKVFMSNKNFIVHYLKDAHSIVKIFTFDGSFNKDLELPSIGTLESINYIESENVSYYEFVSFTTPSTIYKYDYSTNESVEYFRSSLDFDFDEYEINQVFYTSKDGTQIPMFIIYKKGISLDGNNPTLLYGYGGFNISLKPYFSTFNLPFLENDGIFALANIRCGGEYGEKWHLAGTKMNKQNVFDDFIAGAEYLIEQGYTSSDKLGIRGSSNGGLLMGAVVNQRPDLFKVSLPNAGVLDMLQYQNFTVGYRWANDYGTSDDSKEMFEYLKAYSPIHNVKPDTSYPAILVTTSDHDDRVVSAHSYKYIAQLQEKNPNNANPLMIRVSKNAGHGTGSQDTLIEEFSDRIAFLFKNLGITPYNF